MEQTNFAGMEISRVGDSVDIWSKGLHSAYLRINIQPGNCLPRGGDLQQIQQLIPLL